VGSCWGEGAAGNKRIIVLTLCDKRLLFVKAGGRGNKKDGDGKGEKEGKKGGKGNGENLGQGRRRRQLIKPAAPSTCRKCAGENDSEYVHTESELV